MKQMIQLVRIDHRLLHGQVVFSWVRAIGANHIVVADDKAATDEFLKMSLSLAKPNDVALDIVKVSEAGAHIGKLENKRVMVILRGTREAVEFFDSCPDLKEINYGGIAKKEGSVQYSQSIYLTPSEVADSKYLSDKGVRLFMQQVPSTGSEALNSRL